LEDYVQFRRITNFEKELQNVERLTTAVTLRDFQEKVVENQRSYFLRMTCNKCKSRKSLYSDGSNGAKENKEWIFSSCNWEAFY